MAQRHPGSSRSRTGESKTAEADDVFVARILEFMGWAKGNSQVLILFGIALAVILAGTLYYVNWRSGQAEVAVGELERISQAVGVSDPQVSKTSLEQYLERFAGTPYAAEARLLLAQLYLDGGEAGQAMATLEASSVSLRDPLGVQLATLEARALEAQDRLDEAESLYIQIADQAELSFQRIGALDDAARLRMRAGNFAGAADLYERLLADEEFSVEQQGIYEMRLGEARTAAGS